MTLEREFALFLGGHLSTESSTATLKSPPTTNSRLGYLDNQDIKCEPRVSNRRSLSVLVLGIPTLTLKLGVVP